jgi:hypothetical protein
MMLWLYLWFFHNGTLDVQSLNYGIITLFYILSGWGGSCKLES